jgi:hypothetical protein
MKRCITFKACVLLFLLCFATSIRCKERKAKEGVSNQHIAGYVKRIYDPPIRR